MLPAVINGIYSLKWSEFAHTALNKLLRTHIFPNDLKSCTRMVQGFGMKIDLSTSKLRDIGALSKAKTGQCLSGIWILRYGYYVLATSNDKLQVEYAHTATTIYGDVRRIHAYAAMTVTHVTTMKTAP